MCRILRYVYDRTTGPTDTAVFDEAPDVVPPVVPVAGLPPVPSAPESVPVVAGPASPDPEDPEEYESNTSDCYRPECSDISD